jgi:hypothetical protein
MNKHATVFFKSFLLLATVVPFLPGCAPPWQRSDTGIIWGKVNYKGGPLTGGNMHFVQDGQKKAALAIRGDGTYSGEVPVGQYKVAIETESIKYRDRDKMLEKWQEEVGPELVQRKQQERPTPGLTAAKVIYVEIPARYSDPEKSGLSYEVTAGKQERDFNLE